jgi:hypothetical protein
MRWAGLVARIGEVKSAYKMSGGNLNGENYFTNPGVHGRIILKRILKK